MKPSEIKIGDKFGKLTVVGFGEPKMVTTGGRTRKKLTFVCECSCPAHTKIIVIGDSLVYGVTKSCGCARHNTYDLAGKRFGSLTVIKKAPDHVNPNTGKKQSKWVCRCDCGCIHEVLQSNLLNEHVKCCPNCKSNAFKDLTGQTFGSLTVIERGPDYIWNGEKEVQWWCECNRNDCEDWKTCKQKRVLVRGHNLRSGKTKSTGCGILHEIHGGHGTRLYSVWAQMKKRCYNPNVSEFCRYGGKKDKNGNPAPITICDEWKDDFAAFRNWAMSHGYDENAEKFECTIDRIDNSKGYFPDNCRFVSMKIQANNKDNNRIVEIDGEKHTVAEWSDTKEIASSNIYNRLDLGWSAEDVLNTPVNDYIIKVTNSNGETHTLAEWECITGNDKKLLYDRIFRQNWDVDRALYTPSLNFYQDQYITYDGITATMEEWGESIGIPVGFLYDKINRSKCDPYKVLSSNPVITGINKETNKTELVQLPINAIYFLDDNGHPISEAEHDKLENNN